MRYGPIKTALIKVGTDVITKSDGYLESDMIASIAEQVSAVREKIPRVALVTSGAVATGRAEYHRRRTEDETLRKKQHYAAVGQALLIAEYHKHFKEHGIVTAQVLLTGHDMDSRVRRRNIRGTLEEIFDDETSTIPIVNENDPVATRELKLTDNDELAGHVALLIKAERVVLLTSVDGLLRDVHDPQSLVREVPFGSKEWKKFVTNGTSGNGRGGMMNKCRIAERLAKHGIETVIASGKEEDVLKRILLTREQIGTRFHRS